MQFAGIEEVAASAEFACQADECGGPVRIDEPALFVPIVRHRPIPAIVLIEAPAFQGLSFRWWMKARDVHDWRSDVAAVLIRDHRKGSKSSSRTSSGISVRAMISGQSSSGGLAMSVGSRWTIWRSS